MLREVVRMYYVRRCRVPQLKKKVSLTFLTIDHSFNSGRKTALTLSQPRIVN